MVNEAKQFEEQDKQRKEEVEIRNAADSLMYTAEKTKSDLADKLSSDLVDKLNAAIVAVKSALEGKDTAKIKSETEKLQKVLGEAGTAAYQQAAQRQAQEQAGSQGVLPGVNNPARRQPVRVERRLSMLILKSRMRNNHFSRHLWQKGITMKSWA